jgi:hypothetical protein
MAGTSSVQISMTVSAGGASVSGACPFQQATSNPGFIGSEQAIGTSETSIDLGAVGSTPLGVMIWNLDATNYVQVDNSSAFTNFPQKVLPGQAIYLAPETGTLYAKANTSGVTIYVVSC